MNKIVILWADDWSVLYVNGKEKRQGHMVDVEHIREYCPIQSIVEQWINEDLLVILNERGDFPDLSIVLEKMPELKEYFD